MTYNNCIFLSFLVFTHTAGSQSAGFIGTLDFRLVRSLCVPVTISCDGWGIMLYLSQRRQ